MLCVYICVHITYHIICCDSNNVLVQQMAERATGRRGVFLGEVDAEDLLVLRLGGAQACKRPAQQVLTGPETWMPII